MLRSWSILGGVICCALTTIAARANVIADGGFESVGTLNGLPGATGFWANDQSSIVTAENGITPHAGIRMLRFEETSFDGTRSTLASEVIQLVDLTSYASDIDAGLITAHGSVYVNRVQGDEQTDTEFGLRVRAHAGSPAGFPSAPSTSLDLALVDFLSDGDVQTWQLLETSLLLPAGTRYLSVWVVARENILNDTTGSEFDGHYADSVSVTLVPEPGALSLLGLAAAAALRRRRRAR